MPDRSCCQGFYYDAFYGDLTLSEEDLESIKLQAEIAVQVGIVAWEGVTAAPGERWGTRRFVFII